MSTPIIYNKLKIFIRICVIYENEEYHEKDDF